MVVAGGDWFQVECAVRSDMSSPVEEFLGEVQRGVREAPPSAEPMEPDEQVDWHKWFVAACSTLARTGYPVHNRSFNQLRDGIWEFKHAALRVSFYDTDGEGGHEPKIDDQPLGYFASRSWPDNFEYFLRLTTAFDKCGPKVDPAEIALADTVREEDLGHDATEGDLG